MQSADGDKNGKIEKRNEDELSYRASSVWKLFSCSLILRFLDSMASLLSFTLPKPVNLIRASAATTTSTTSEALNDKFALKGINFYDSNNVPFVDLTVRNGSSVRVRIPDAHVTSYKPKVNWKDDGFEEVLYTVPAACGDNLGRFKGGIGLVINDSSDSGSKGSLLSASEWNVKDVDSDSIDALQVFALLINCEKS